MGLLNSQMAMGQNPVPPVNITIPTVSQNLSLKFMLSTTLHGPLLLPHGTLDLTELAAVAFVQQVQNGIPQATSRAKPPCLGLSGHYGSFSGVGTLSQAGVKGSQKGMPRLNHATY